MTDLLVSDDDGQTAPTKRTSVDMTRSSRTSHGQITQRNGEDKEPRLGQSTDGPLFSGLEGGQAQRSSVVLCCTALHHLRSSLLFKSEQPYLPILADLSVLFVETFLLNIFFFRQTYGKMAFVIDGRG